MPSVLIETRCERASEDESKIMEAVHLALREAFKIKADDKNVRLISHAPHRFACPPGKATPELYTHISIDALAGRSMEAKRNLYKAIVANLESLGIPKDHVKILLREIPTTNWGVRGGQAASDIDLGFKIDV
jgi:phenylpyruvate tautomerase PptA (4-oxalocrotonate tautomerase family)